MAGQQKITGIFPQIGPMGKDCNNATNAACGIPMKDGCEARFYSDKCNTPVSATQMNAVISEIGNVIKDGGVEYDCGRLDNLADGVQGMIDKNLFGCLKNNFDTIENSCSIRYLVLSTSYDEQGEACQKISIYDQEDATITTGSEASSERIPSGYSGSFPMDKDLYDTTTLYVAQSNNNIDAEKLRKSHLTTLNIDLPCTTQIEILTRILSVDMTSADILNGISYMIDGSFIFNPNFPEDERFIHREPFTKYETAPELTTKQILSPGKHTIKIYLLSGTTVQVDRRFNDTVNSVNTIIKLAL